MWFCVCVFLLCYHPTLRWFGTRQPTSSQARWSNLNQTCRYTAVGNHLGEIRDGITGESPWDVVIFGDIFWQSYQKLASEWWIVFFCAFVPSEFGDLIEVCHSHYSLFGLSGVLFFRDWNAQKEAKQPSGLAVFYIPYVSLRLPRLTNNIPQFLQFQPTLT